MKLLQSPWTLVILSALFDSYAAFIVKNQFNVLGKINYGSMSSIFEYILNFLKHPILFTAIVTFVAAPFMWFLALNRLELSLAYPVLVGFHLLFVMILGIAFLGEALTPNKMIGSTLILVSLFFFYKN